MFWLDLISTVMRARKLREFSINLLLFVGTLLALFAAGRAAGVIDIVGYELKAKFASGLLVRSREPISLVTPVWLNQGDSLIGHYNIKGVSATANLYVSKGAIGGWQAGDKTVSDSGQWEFVANEAGYYMPGSYFSGSAYNESDECAEKRRERSRLQRALVPDLTCPSAAGGYSVLWTVQNG